MKTLKYIVIALCSILLFSTCEEYEFLNLKRDNPLDGKNNANMQHGVALKFNSYSIYSDNNGDGFINKGETIKLQVSLKNNGTSTANSVKATFSCTSSYVSNFSPTTQISFGRIDDNAVKWADYQSNNGAYSTSLYHHTLQFTVSNNTPAGTQIPISISMVDESGNTWTSNFNVTVY